MGVKVTNNAWGTLAAGISASDVTLSLTSGQGARFPALTAGQWFWLTLADAANNLEIVKCTARSGDTLTVVRGQDGTTAKAYNTSDRVELRPTAALFNDKLDVDVAAATYAELAAFNNLNATNLTSGTVPLARLANIANAQISASAAIDWAKVNKAGSSLADLATRSAADLNSGTLPAARISGAYTGISQVGTLSSFATTGTASLGTGNAGDKYLTLWSDTRSVSLYMQGTGVNLWDASGGFNRWQTDASGNLVVYGNITAQSDARYKSDITPIGRALEKLHKIRGVTYNRDDVFGSPRHAGVLAQEVREVLPEVVEEDVTGILSVAYGNLSALLIEAVKELDKKVDHLAKRVK